MSDSLDRIHAELDGAVEYTENLAADIATAFEVDPSDGRFGCVFERDDPNCHLGVRFVAGTMPLTWSIRFGDGVHRVRSALNHLVWGLVLANGGTVNTSLEFPIFKDEPVYGRHATRKLGGMDPAAMALIESLQPFNVWPTKPEAAALWLIYDMDRIDKHQRLLLMEPWLTNWTSNLTPEIGTCTVNRGGGPIEDGAQIIAYTIPHDFDGQVDMEFTAHFAVGVESHIGADDNDQPAPVHIADFVHRCVDRLRADVLPHFEPFLT